MKRDANLETSVEDIRGIFTENNKVVYVGEDGMKIYSRSYITSEDRPLFSSKEKNKTHLIIGYQEKDDFWSGLTLIEGGYLLLDGFKARMLRLDASFKLLSIAPIGWKDVLPPKDRLGEAPMFEVKRLREKFNLEMMAAPGRRIKSMTLLSNKKGVYEILALTSTKNFPVVEIRCLGEKEFRCSITRACRSGLIKGVDFNHRAGLTKRTHDSSLYFVDSRKKVVYGGLYKGCLDISFQDTYGLPDRLPKISSAFVGPKFLWLGTESKDNYFNSSIFPFIVEKR